VCWDNSSLEGVEHLLPYRHDQLALAVPLYHALARRRSLSFEETLGHEYVGPPPSSGVQTLLRCEAARLGRTIDYRVIVSNFDAAFRVVASGLAVGIMPMLAGEQFGALRRIKLIPLTDACARRRFIVCFRT
jgi:DNA-binding transcriptional LysR family regulator